MAYHDLMADSSDHPAARSGPIVVAVELPAFLASQVQVVRLLGRQFGVPLLLMHITDDVSPSADLPHRLGVTAEELEGITLVADTGDPAERILKQAQARSSSLLVMGMPGTIDSADAGTLAIAERVLVGAPCPVLFVPEVLPAAWGMNGRILVPLDGTPSTAGVMLDAMRLAQRLQAALEVVYIAGERPVPQEPGTMTVPRFADETQHEWRQWRQEFLSRFADCARSGLPPVDVHLTVRTGPVAAAIRATAEGSRPALIVIGWHGRITPDRAQVLRRLLPDSPWPVLVIRVPAGAGEMCAGARRPQAWLWAW
jgi:nucleotide-binding universal stress UspA family protein